MLPASADVALRCAWEVALQAVSSESFIFRFPLSAYPVLDGAPLAGPGAWGLSARPGTLLSRLGEVWGGWWRQHSVRSGSVYPVYIMCP